MKQRRDCENRVPLLELGAKGEVEVAPRRVEGDDVLLALSR